MSWLTDVRERVSSLLFRGREEREMAEELAFHVERETEAGVRRGLEPAEARRRAMLKLGGVERTKEEVRDARGVRPLEDVGRDVRHAFRTLGRNPGFTATAVLVLALGIGANTAIFSAVRAVVLKPLPFASPERLYMLWEENPEKNWYKETAAPANYLDWEERVESFADVEAYEPYVNQVVLTGREEPQLLRGSSVTGGFFDLVGVRPALGRTFHPSETWDDGEPVVMLSWDGWHTYFGGDTAVIGSLISLSERDYRVVGVMPEGFSFPEEDLDLWGTTEWSREGASEVWFRRAHWVRPVARLVPGATPERAAAELQTVVSQLQEEYPETNAQMGAGMTALHEFLLGDTRTPLLVLLGSVALLLLIACANVGNLLLVRAAARERDLAVRRAMGAGRGRIVRQVLTESAVLATAGGAAGLVLGLAGTRLLEALQPEGLLRVSRFSIDAGVVGYIVGITAAAALLFGAIPSLLAGRGGPAAALREAGRTGAQGRGTRRVVGGLVIAEVGLALLLVVGAGLLVRSFLRLQQVDPGFDGERVAVVTLNLPGARYDSRDRIVAFYDEVLERIRARPEVESAAASTTMPLRERGFTSDFFIAGRAPDEYGSEVVRRRVTPGYFETMGVPLLRGRFFTDADDRGAERVALINQAMADQYFPGEDPVGQRITSDRVPNESSIWRTIVGVVGNERQTEIAAPAKVELIDPFRQDWSSRMNVYVEVGAGEPSRAIPIVRAIVGSIDPSLALHASLTMEEVHADSMARQRFLMTLLLLFALVALVLALVGVYGVTAQAARQRLQEIGIRMALGARAADVVRLTLARGLGLVALGLAAGLAVALVASRAMAAMLYDVAPTDPGTYAAVAALLAAAGALASWLPARRASRVDPATVLRTD